MISIIGSGNVGAAIAFLIAVNGLDDIVLLNRTKDKAVGEAMDLRNAIRSDSGITITPTDDYSDTKGSDIVIITASTQTYHTTRTENLDKQASMARGIIDNLEKHMDTAKIILVSNPLDVLTYLFIKESKFPKNGILGVAATLDSIRFRYLLSRELKCNMSEIQDAVVLGEHGDSMVPIFSIAKKNHTSVNEVLTQSQKAVITQDLRGYWKNLRRYKNRSVFGIAKQTVDITKILLEKSNAIIPISVEMKGQYGISDTCIGIPVKITNGQIDQIQEINLEREEMVELQKSADIVKGFIRQAGIK